MATEKTEAEINAEAVLNEPLEPIPDEPVSETPPVADVTETPASETVTTEERPAEESTTFQAPEELRAPIAPGPAPTQPINDYERQRLEHLESQANQMQMVAQAQEIDKQSAQLKTYYENQGWDPTTADAMANIHKVERAQANEQIGAMQTQINLDVARQNAANSLGKEYNVDPADLVEFGSFPEMKRHALSLAYIAKQDKRITNLEQKNIPEQHYDGGVGITGGPMNSNEILAAMANPDFNPTDAQREQVNKLMGLNGG